MTWWQRLRRNREMEDRLEKELRFHLDEHAAHLIAGGLSPAEARRRAQLALGGAEQVKEECRDARGTRWLLDLAQDFRYAVRTLQQRPGFAAVALLTLALGCGATTVMFSVINGVLLKPFPYADPERLLLLQEKTTWSTQFGDLWTFTYPNFLDCRRQVRSLELAGLRHGGGTVSSPGEAGYLERAQVSSELFSVLRVSPLRGRAFLPEDDRPGAPPVAIISYSVWQQRFAANSTAIGAPLVFDGQPYTVVGIAPDGFRLGDEEVDVLTPLGQDTSPRMQSRTYHGVRVWARLRAGATLAEARGELAAIGRALEEQYPKTNRGRTFVAEPLRPDVGDVGSTLWLLLGAVGLVLLIACANVASLLLARAVSRGRELALRAAIGAGRGRLVRQCLTESAVLALGGGLLGMLLAAIGVRPFIAFWPGSLPRAAEVRLDWQVLAVSLAVALTGGLLFGLAPALHVPSRHLDRTLRSGARAVAGSSHRLHGGFVVSEIALAVVLLVAAGMLGRTLLRLSSVDPGVNIHNVVTARAALSPASLASPAAIRTAWEDVLDRARRVPGVEAVTMVDTVPMREGNNLIGYRSSAADMPPGDRPTALASSVTPEYLKVMGVALRRGRFFTSQDRIGSAGVVVIDEVMAQQAFGTQDPIGRQLWIELGSDPVTIVGVVGHVRYWGLAADDQARWRAQLYYPFAQVPDTLLRRWSELMSIAVRTGMDPLSAVAPLRRELRGAARDQVLYEVRTLEQLARASLSRQRFLMLLFAIFAGLALLLASIGIYGVLAYLTSHRIPEIGLRLALGATAGDVMRMVLRQSAGMIGAGVVLGVSAAAAAGHLMARLVDGMRSTDLLTFAIMLPVLVLAALTASYLPARRASRIDPMRALRQD